MLEGTRQYLGELRVRHGVWCSLDGLVDDIACRLHAVVLRPHDGRRLLDAVAFQQWEERVLLPVIVALRLMEVQHQGTQLCQDGLCLGIPVLSAQLPGQGKSLLKPADYCILLQDEALQRVTVQHHSA